MSGVEVMKRVRSNPKTTHLPVIAVTAYSLADDIERFREQGFTDCVPKPVSRENLLKVLAKYIT
jgi:CheY-like chemotaxis protein